MLVRVGTPTKPPLITQSPTGVLATAAKCITDVINSRGHIIVDFADVCTVMKNRFMLLAAAPAVTIRISFRFLFARGLFCEQALEGAAGPLELVLQDLLHRGVCRRSSKSQGSETCPVTWLSRFDVLPAGP